MLHEILLSLSGHPSPLLRAASSSEAHESAGASLSGLSPPERALLASLAHLADLHLNLLSSTAQIAASHPSTTCRAVAGTVNATHLAAFQRKVLQVEDTILRKDAGLVGAYNIVPLTAVVGEFDCWIRRMEWLWDMVQYMLETKSDAVSASCTGASIIDRLRAELQTGYADVQETARTLVKVAEMAWLKQVSAWILYGRLPIFGAEDFFIQQVPDENDYICVMSLLPSFVTAATSASVLFIGRSLNQIRARSAADAGLGGGNHLSKQLKELSKLTSPLDPAALLRKITGVRKHLSRAVLQKLLPVSQVLEMLQLLREFFLLGRGEFAMALTQQADEKMRRRWKQADHLAFEERDGLGTVTMREGELAAVLGKTWQALGSLQGQHAEEDEILELARDLLRLSLVKSRSCTPARPARPVTPVTPVTPMTPTAAEGGLVSIVSTPFHNLLVSVPAALTFQIPSPLDLFLSHSDVQTYSSINAYLLSVRRAHIRLTDLWKITSIRRHHPPPPGPPYGSTPTGRQTVKLLRERHMARSGILRSAWTTASAVIFFLGETESYLQNEVVAGLWDGFQQWLMTGNDDPSGDGDGDGDGDATISSERTRGCPPPDQPPFPDSDQDDQDLWLDVATSTRLKIPPTSTSPAHQPHDPQTLATAHRLYLTTLVRRLLLDQHSFTDPLYALLVQIDRLVALVHRLHGVWTAADLEADAGVVDAFVDPAREEADVRAGIRLVEARIKAGIEGLVTELGKLEAGNALREDDADDDGEDWSGEETRYVPRRTGSVDRLLMKLDFGSWFGDGGT